MSPSAKRCLLLYGALCLPFFLNDFANIYVEDFNAWLALDFLLVKVLPVGGMIWAVRRGWLRWGDFGLRSLPLLLFIYYSLAMSVLGVLLDQYGYDFFMLFLPTVSWGAIPKAPEGSLLGWLDLHLGLFLVAVVEEMVFRGLAFTAFVRAGLRPVWALPAAAIVFGCIHWSLGPAAVATGAVIGGVFGLCVWRTGSALPLIVAHFLVNYVYFAF